MKTMNGTYIRRSEYSLHYQQEQKCKRTFNRIILFFILVNICLWAYIIYIFYAQKSNFKLGLQISFILTILNFAAMLVKVCLYDKGSNPQERTIEIYWLCCVRIGRPKDLDELFADYKSKEESKANLKSTRSIKSLMNQSRKHSAFLKSIKTAKGSKQSIEKGSIEQEDLNMIQHLKISCKSDLTAM